jgi:hypothetical protein
VVPATLGGIRITGHGHCHCNFGAATWLRRNTASRLRWEIGSFAVATKSNPRESSRFPLNESRQSTPAECAPEPNEESRGLISFAASSSPARWLQISSSTLYTVLYTCCTTSHVNYSSVVPVCKSTQNPRWLNRRRSSHEVPFVSCYSGRRAIVPFTHGGAPGRYVYGLYSTYPHFSDFSQLISETFCSVAVSLSPMVRS